MRRTAWFLVLATGIAVAFLDRPLAGWVDRTLASPALFRWADGFFTFLLVGGGILVALCLGISGLVLSRRPLRPWMSPLRVSCAAGLAALALSESLKFIVGRSPVYPTFVVEGIHRFAPFHWGSFPSSTTAATTAVGSVLWISWPKARPAYLSIGLVIYVVIVAVSAHWLSDVLAGILLGGLTASRCRRALS